MSDIGIRFESNLVQIVRYRESYDLDKYGCLLLKLTNDITLFAYCNLIPLAFLMYVHLQVLVAGYTAGQRAEHVPHGKYIAGVSILSGTSITTFLLVILNVFPFTPRYIIPVVGMMVGSAMTVTGVSMKKLREDIKIQKDLVMSQNHFIKLCSYWK